ncbi:MAG: hypothetical protein ABW007_13105 [Chitinophagaceae bacterium]
MRTTSTLLFILIIALLQVACISGNKQAKALRQDTMTGRFANAFYAIDASRPNTTTKRTLKNKEFKLLQRDLNFIIGQIRKNQNALITRLNEQAIPDWKIRMDVNDYPNMYPDCSLATIFINTGLIREFFDKSFRANFSSTSMFAFSKLSKNAGKVNSDSSLYAFLDLLYKARLKKFNFIRAFINFDDDDIFDPLETMQDLQITIARTDAELVKILAFLISHEYYHVLTACAPSRENEIKADVYGVLQYARLDPNHEFTAIFQDLVGRPMSAMFYEIYADSTVVKRTEYLYLSIEERVQRVNHLLDSLGETNLKIGLPGARAIAN